MPTLIYNNKQFKYFEPSGNGKNFTSFRAQPQSSDIIYDLPTSDGINGQVLCTNGNCRLSWTTPSVTQIAGSGTELQYRNNGNLGAITGSSFASNILTIPSTIIKDQVTVSYTELTGGAPYVIFANSNSPAAGASIFFGNENFWSSHANRLTVYAPAFDVFADGNQGAGQIRFYTNSYGWWSDTPKFIWDEYGNYKITSGKMIIGSSSLPTSMLDIVTSNSTTVSQKITLASGQSANAFEVNSYGGNDGDIAKIDKDGNLTLGNQSSGGRKSITVYDTSSYGGYIQLSGPGVSGKLTADNVGSYTQRTFSITTSGTDRIRFGDWSSSSRKYASLRGDVVLTWTDGNVAGINVGDGTNDVGIARNASGILEINTSTVGSYGNLILKEITATKKIINYANSNKRSFNLLAYGSTTNATPSLLYLDGSSEHIQITANSTWLATVEVIGRSGDEAIVQSWKALIFRGSGNATLQGDPYLIWEEKTSTASSELWNSEINVDNVGLGLHDKLFINVTGYSGRTINWLANITILEING